MCPPRIFRTHSRFGNTCSCSSARRQTCSCSSARRQTNLSRWRSLCHWAKQKQGGRPVPSSQILECSSHTLQNKDTWICFGIRGLNSKIEDNLYRWIGPQVLDTCPLHTAGTHPSLTHSYTDPAHMRRTLSWVRCLCSQHCTSIDCPVSKRYARCPNALGMTHKLLTPYSHWTCRCPGGIFGTQ